MWLLSLYNVSSQSEHEITLVIVKDCIVVTHFTQQAVRVRASVSGAHFSLKTFIATSESFHIHSTPALLGMLFCCINPHFTD